MRMSWAKPYSTDCLAWGRSPCYAAPLQAEGIVSADLGIGGSITFRDFRGPGRRHSWKRSWFTGGVVLTRKTFAAFALFRPVIYVPLDDARIRELDCTVKGSILCISFDAGVFNPKWSGSIECRFKTPQARFLDERLSQARA